MLKDKYTQISILADQIARHLSYLQVDPLSEVERKRLEFRLKILQQMFERSCNSILEHKDEWK